jgi:alpha-glucosidase
VPPTYKTHNVAAELKDSDSVLSFYKSVLELRHTNKALLEGSYVPLNENDQKVLSYLRVGKDETVLVVLNMSAVPRSTNFELSKKGFKSATKLIATGKSSVKGDVVTLEPFGVFIGELSK